MKIMEEIKEILEKPTEKIFEREREKLIEQNRISVTLGPKV